VRGLVIKTIIFEATSDLLQQQQQQHRLFEHRNGEDGLMQVVDEVDNGEWCIADAIDADGYKAIVLFRLLSSHDRACTTHASTTTMTTMSEED
jgi:hypothetical protein